MVLVDVNRGHNKDVDEKYDNPTRLGLPVIVILDADGKRLTTKDTAELEEGDHHSPAKVLAFLKTKEWVEKPAPTPHLSKIEEFRDRALQEIKAKKPEIKTETLEFVTVTYSYQPVGKRFQEDVNVSFRDISTRVEGTAEGQKTMTFELTGVQFKRDTEGREQIFVNTGGKITLFN